MEWVLLEHVKGRLQCYIDITSIYKYYDINSKQFIKSCPMSLHQCDFRFDLLFSYSFPVIFLVSFRFYHFFVLVLVLVLPIIF